MTSLPLIPAGKFPGDEGEDMLRIATLICTSLLTACTLVPGKQHDTQANAAPDPRDLAPAAPVFAYNLMTLGDATLSSSSAQGRIAVGGDAQLSSYGVGTTLREDGTRCDLAVAGNLDFDQGSVFQGKICTQGTIHTTDVGTKFPGSATTGIDFAALGTAATSLSDDLAKLAPDQTIDDKYLNGGRGRLVFTGTKADFNVFSVTAAALALGTGILVQVPAGATAIINVVGASATVADLGVALSGPDATHVLINAPSLTALSLTRSTLQGSLLAPRAALKFAEGKIVGSIVADSVEGDGQFILMPYTGKLSAPAS